MSQKYAYWKVVFLDTDDGCAFDTPGTFGSLPQALKFIAEEIMDMVICSDGGDWKPRIKNFEALHTIDRFRAAFRRCPLPLTVHTNDTNLIRTIQVDTMNWIIMPIDWFDERREYKNSPRAQRHARMA